MFKRERLSLKEKPLHLSEISQACNSFHYEYLHDIQIFGKKKLLPKLGVFGEFITLEFFNCCAHFQSIYLNSNSNSNL